jgi:uncharacterized protein with HEPN domain
MSDRDIMVLGTLEEIAHSLVLIRKRFDPIRSTDDFLADESGLTTLDSISMRLIAIGEAFKNIDKLTDKKLLVHYPQINWKGVKGIRDILSHHYFDLDAETIYVICRDEIAPLTEVVDTMIASLKSKP